MKLLLDECCPVRLRRHLPGHDVFTVDYMGWKGIRNGRLLALASADGFEALLTTDKAMADQQNLGALPVALIVLQAKRNVLASLLPLVPRVLHELAHLKPNSLVIVS